MPRAKQRTPALRDRLLQAALAALARDGIAGLTTRAVARDAATSAPAVYELFGDKTGLVRELFFEGFRLLRRRLDPLVPTADARADVARVVQTFRAFVRDNPMLSALMFSRPFAAFDPGPVEEEAGSAVRLYIVAQVQRGIDAGVLAGDATDIAHVLVSMAQGLAATERAGWLGRSKASIDRRWEVAIRAVLDGLRPGPANGARAPRRR